MMRKILTISEGILFMVMLIAMAGVDSPKGGDICCVLILASVIGLFVMSKVEEQYVGE